MGITLVIEQAPDKSWGWYAYGQTLPDKHKRLFLSGTGFATESEATRMGVATYPNATIGKYDSF